MPAIFIDFSPPLDIKPSVNKTILEFFVMSVTSIRSKQKTLTAKQFLAFVDAGQTDFSESGKLVVTEDIYLSKRKIHTPVHLGELVFERGFHCGFTEFYESFNFGSATFKGGFYCNTAVFFTFVEAESAVFQFIFDFGSATFRRSFNLGEAIFEEDVLGGQAVILGSLIFEEARLEKKFIGGNLKTSILEFVRCHVLLLFHFQRMEISDILDFGDVKFRSDDAKKLNVLRCGSAVITGVVKMGYPEFEIVHGDDAAYLGWIIREYKENQMVFQPENAPPEMKPDWLWQLGLQGS